MNFTRDKVQTNSYKVAYSEIRRFLITKQTQILCAKKKKTYLLLNISLISRYAGMI